MSVASFCNPISRGLIQYFLPKVKKYISALENDFFLYVALHETIILHSV